MVLIMTKVSEYRWQQNDKLLKGARERRALTQEEVGERVRVRPQMVWYWEAGRSRPNPDHLMTLAALYGVSVDWLLGNEPLPEGEEEEVLMLYRQIPEAQRPLVRRILEAAARYETGEEEADQGAS